MDLEEIVNKLKTDTDYTYEIAKIIISLNKPKHDNSDLIQDLEELKEMLKKTLENTEEIKIDVSDTLFDFSEMCGFTKIQDFNVISEASSETPKEEILRRHTMEELYNICRTSGYRGYSYYKTKDTLVNFILSKD